MRGSGVLNRFFARGPGADPDGTGAGDPDLDPADGPDAVDTEVIATAAPAGDGPGAEQGNPTVPLPADRPADPPDENVGSLLAFAVGALPSRTRLRHLLGTAGHLIVLSPRTDRSLGGAVPVVAALWAVAAGCLAGLLVAVAASVDNPVQSAPWLWLAGNHATVHTELGAVTLLPLGLLLISLLPLRRSGTYIAARTDARSLRGAAIAAVAVYSVAAAIIAAAWGGGHFAAITAAPWAAACAVVGGGWGISRARRDRRSQRPPVVTGIARTAAAPIALGLPLLLAAVVAARDSVVAVQSGVAAGFGEHLGLVLLQLAYLPNLVVWAGSYVVGGGVVIGAETVSPYSDGNPLLPELPVLQAFAADAPDWTAMLPILVALAAALAAMLTNRRQPIARLGHRITRAVVISAGAGLVWLVLSAVSGGSVGEDRLAHLGPAPITPVLVGLAALAGTMLWAILPTVASDARPVATDIRERVVKSKDTLVAASERKRG